MIKIVTVTGKIYYINNVNKHYFNGIINNIELDGLRTISVNFDKKLPSNTIEYQKVLMVSSIEYMEYIEREWEWL